MKRFAVKNRSGRERFRRSVKRFAVKNRSKTKDERRLPLPTRLAQKSGKGRPLPPWRGQGGAPSLGPGIRVRRLCDPDGSSQVIFGAPRWGWPARARRQLGQMEGYRGEDARHVGGDLVAPEPDHAVTACLEPARPLVIMRRLGSLAVLPAINLDHQPLFKADEIDDECADRVLAAEAEAVDLAAAQSAPKTALRRAHVSAQGSGTLVGHDAQGSAEPVVGHIGEYGGHTPTSPRRE